MKISYKTFHYICKLYSNLLSNPREGSLAFEAGKTQKNDNFLKKTEKKHLGLIKIKKSRKFSKKLRKIEPKV